jgi:hypothetical protein
VRISEDGKTALVGAPGGAPCPGTAERTCGAVYVYGRSQAGWSLEATLTPEDGGYPGFGGALALSPDATVALVGGASASCPESATIPCGLLYVFSRGGAGWTQEKRIVDALVSGQYQQGISLALSTAGATALVAGPPQSCAYGAPSCRTVHVFTRDGGAWTLCNGFLPGNQSSGTLTLAMSRDGTTALVGMPDCSASGGNCGSQLFIYANPAANQLPTAHVDASSPSHGLGFSIGLSGDGDVAVAGDPSHPCGDQPSVCSAGFIFRRTGSTWAEERRLPATDSSSPLSFGARVALSLDGGTAVFEAENRQCSECADLFLSKHRDGAWSGPVPLASSLPGAILPISIQPLAISGDGTTVLLGAPVTDCAAGQDCGTVHIFEGVSADALEVPALGGVGLALLALLLAASGSLLLLRRRLRPAR